MNKEKPIKVTLGLINNEIDVNKPKETSKKSGFLLEERWLMDKILKIGFVDTFRELNPNQIQYTWRSYRARNENNAYGWRFGFDYIKCRNKRKLKFFAINQIKL